MTEKPSKYHFTVDAGSQLSERDAVELSKQALVKYGEDLNRIRPVQRYPSPKIPESE